MQRENNPTQVELSAIWLELLGQSTLTHVPASTAEESLPTLETDPWSHLLGEQGTKIVDLQKVSLHMSDQEVEQLLQSLQEQKEP